MVIVMGMHRSGTSVVARILGELGVFMGADMNDHAESAFFLRQNQWVFEVAHAYWDNPSAVRYLLELPDLSELVTLRLTERWRGPSARRYWGTARFAVRRFAGPWMRPPMGWKDPRTTFTLPLWLRLFPQARVVHVVRDGLDVAASLVAREQRRRTRLGNAARSCRCLDPERAFDLWTEYVDMGEHVAEALPAARYLRLRYEDLLEGPHVWVGELARVAGTPADEGRIAAAAALLDVGRATRRSISGDGAGDLEELRRRRVDDDRRVRLGYAVGARP